MTIRNSLPTGRQSLEQLLVNAPEPAVRHQDNQIPVLMFSHNGLDDVVDRSRLTGRLSTSAQITHQIRNRQTFLVRKRRSKHRRQNDFGGAGEGAREIILE